MRNLLLAFTMIVLAGCAHVQTGRGAGTWRMGGGDAATFDWTSRGSVKGTLTATFADGRTFTGSYFQITEETRVDRLDPLWEGWHDAWRGWRHWHAEPTPEFIRHYSGRVLANLAAPDGERMRCRFRLVVPSAGLRGGAQGRCQTADGRLIDVDMPQR